jgi:hypothetical protein
VQRDIFQANVEFIQISNPESKNWMDIVFVVSRPTICWQHVKALILAIFVIKQTIIHACALQNLTNVVQMKLQSNRP